MQIFQGVYVLCHILTVSVVAFSGGRVIPHRSRKHEPTDNTVWSVRWAAAQLIAVWGFSYTFFLPLYMLELPPEPEAIINTFLTFAIIMAASVASVWSVNEFLQLKANKREWLPYVVVPELATFIAHLVVSTPLTLYIYFLSVVGVMIFGIWYFCQRYRIYKRLILEEYSDLTDREQRWVWGLLVAMAMQSTNFIAGCVFDIVWLEFLGMIIVCVSSILLQQCAFHTKALSPYLIEQAAMENKAKRAGSRTTDNVAAADLDQLVTGPAEKEGAQPKASTETATDEADAADGNAADTVRNSRQRVYAVIRKRLKELCEDELLFLDPDLTREMLCGVIKVNRTYLTDYLHSEGTTYYNYINNLRVRYAVQILHETPDLPIVDVSYRSGYSTPATFRRAFRDIMGCLPSEYVAQQVG